MDPVPLPLLLLTRVEGPAAAASSALPVRSAPAQDARGPMFSAEQLEQIVAPIALHPDELPSRLLMAASYPLEVVRARRFMHANPRLTGEALENALKPEDWAPSVKATCAFPDLPARMDDDLDWLRDLGDALLAQESELMDAAHRAGRRTRPRPRSGARSCRERARRAVAAPVLAEAARAPVGRGRTPTIHDVSGGRPMSFRSHAPVVASLIALLPAACASPAVTRFASPEEAVRAFADSVDDPVRTERLTGWDASQPLCSGDDCEDAAAVRSMAHERVDFVDAGADRKVVLLGHARWELPLPLVRESGGWRFDVEAGKEEIRCRDVGRNELRAIDTLHALVDAQEEYRSAASSFGTQCYAPKWASDPGKRDGLHFSTAEGKPESPLGLIFCPCAEEEASAADPSCSAPCHGYCYRILGAQGPHACGGAREYGDADGSLLDGFAVLAWPAEYGRSGVMTFQIDRLGIVYQKDLGPMTSRDAPKLTAFDPDDTWEPAAD